MFNVECSMFNVEWKSAAATAFSFSIQHSALNIQHLPLPATFASPCHASAAAVSFTMNAHG
jgi:hypothetical protein